MRIAFITPEYITEPNFDGGLANYLYRVSLALKDFGHEPLIIVGTNRDDVIFHGGIQVNRVDVTLPGRAILQHIPYVRRLIPAMQWIWQSWRLNRRLSELQNQQRIDVAQFASYTGTALFRSKEIPSVVRISSMQSLLDSANAVTNTLTRKLQIFIEYFALGKADHLFGPSRLIAEAVANKTGHPVTVIESPFLMSEMRWDCQLYHDLLAGKDYLLFFGTLSRLKGAHVIAAILPDLLSRHSSIYFVFAGKDAGYNGNPMMNHLWEKAGKSRGRIIHLGVLPHHQLYPIIQNARSIVLPSLIDNLPNSCIESMSLGQIVVGTQGASFEQLIDDGSSGFLCTQNDPASLLDKIDRALNLDLSQRNEITKNAKARIAQLAPDLTVKTLIDFYLEIKETARKHCQ